MDWKSDVIECVLLDVELTPQVTMIISYHRVSRAYLVITLSIDGHDEADAACLVLVLWIVESLSLWRLPVHQLRLAFVAFYRLHIAVTRRCHSLNFRTNKICFFARFLSRDKLTCEI